MKRAAILAAIAAYPVLATFLIFGLAFLARWAPDASNYFKDLSNFSFMGSYSAELADTQDEEERRMRDAMRTILAYRLRHPYWQEVMKQYDATAQAEGASAVAEYPDVTEAQLAEARRVLADTGHWRFRVRSRPIADELFLCAFCLQVTFASLAPLAFLCAVIFRGGLWLRLFGIAVQTEDGEQASRIRCLSRALIAWSPIVGTYLILQTLVFLGTPLGRFGLVIEFAVICTPLLVFAAGAIYATLNPERGIQDRLAGTHLVPR